MPLEDRQDLLGHKSSRVTIHYSGPELENVLEADYRVCEDDFHNIPLLGVLDHKAAAACTATA